ncbi:MAG: MATE family efflux transporter [Bdellovibrio sp.]
MNNSFGYRSLLFFSIPSILTSLTEVLASGIDTALVGHLSTLALAALAVASTVFNSFNWLFNFLINSSLEAVANYRGQSDEEKLTNQIRLSIILAIIVGIIATVMLLLGKKLWFSMAGARESFMSELNSYYIIRASFQWLSIIFFTVLSLLRGLGLVQFSFYMILGSTLTNALISYLLIYQFGFGVEGAAIGTVASVFIYFTISILVLIRKQPRILQAPWKKLWGGELKRLGANSRDLFIRSLFLTASFFISTRVASQLGMHTLASHQVLLQAWLLCAYVVDGIAVSGTILGAEKFGQNNIEQCRILSQKLLHMGGVIGLIFTLLYFFGEGQFILLFSKDDKIYQVVGQYWSLIVWSQILNAAAFVYDGLLFGFNRFSYLRKHMIYGVFFIFLPLASFSWIIGALGPLWWGMVLLNLYRAMTGFQEIKRLLS